MAEGEAYRCRLVTVLDGPLRAAVEVLVPDGGGGAPGIMGMARASAGACGQDDGVGESLLRPGEASQAGSHAHQRRVRVVSMCALAAISRCKAPRAGVVGCGTVVTMALTQAAVRQDRGRATPPPASPAA